MGIFTTKETFKASGEFTSMAMKHIKKTFTEKGFKYEVKSESYDRTVIEIQRGCFLHQAVGLRNGLQITFTRNEEQTEVEVRDCILENQLIGPALLFHYLPKFRIPIVVIDGVGLIMQATLPGKAMDAIIEAYEECTGHQTMYCPYCGAPITSEDGVCSNCGKRIIAEVAPAE